MAETLEERLDVIEKRVAQLGAIIEARPHRNDWLATVGTLAEDELSREADRLSREYRDNSNDSNGHAGA